MDKIFKKRFENYQKKAPDHILGNILSEVATEASVTQVSNNALYYKLSIYTFLAIATVVSTIMFWPESQNNDPQNQVLLAEIPAHTNDLQTEVQSVVGNSEAPLFDNKLDSQEEKINTNTIVNPKSTKETESVEIKTLKSSTENNAIDLNILPENNIQEAKVEPLKKPLKIIAPRSTCSSECMIELEHNLNGVWKADKNIFIQSPNDSKTLIKYNDTGKVLLTYTCGNVQDTFSIFFYQPSALTYKLTAQACGERNGKVEFEMPENRVYASTNHLILNQNRFENLIIDNYNIELQDNLGCKYQYNIDLPIENMIGDISHDALEQRVGFPIYFYTDIDLNNAEYIWDFGDGETSYEKKPDHKYMKAGIYDISLKIIKGNCQEIMKLEDFVIQDKEIELPNIFTPNQDGQNDMFYVSTPEDMLEFEVCILDHSGHLVYKWTDPKSGWDGMTLYGQEAEQGTYYYIIKGKDSTHKNFEYKSCLELRR